MIMLKTVTMAFGLFGMASVTMTETVVPDMPSCKSYLEMQQTEFSSMKATTELSKDGTYLATEIDSWPNRASIFRQCVEVK